MLTKEEIEIMIEKLTKMSERYGYYYDEEDTDLERIDRDIGIENISQIKVLKYWTNERLVIPLELVKQELERLNSNTTDEMCLHCGYPVKIRNPSGYCDHLYYPENCKTCEELSKGELKR